MRLVVHTPQKHQKTTQRFLKKAWHTRQWLWQREGRSQSINSPALQQALCTHRRALSSAGLPPWQRHEPCTSYQPPGYWVRAHFKPNACEMGMGGKGNLFILQKLQDWHGSSFYPCPVHTASSEMFLHKQGQRQCWCHPPVPVVHRRGFAPLLLGTAIPFTFPRQFHMKVDSKEPCKIKDYMKEISQASFCLPLKPKFWGNNLMCFRQFVSLCLFFKWF